MGLMFRFYYSQVSANRYIKQLQLVRISLHSTEEINDFNSTLLSVENVSQKMSQNFKLHLNSNYSFCLSCTVSVMQECPSVRVCINVNNSVLI